MFSPELVEQIDCLRDRTHRERKKKPTLKRSKRSDNKCMTFLAINSIAICSLSAAWPVNRSFMPTMVNKASAEMNGVHYLAPRGTFAERTVRNVGPCATWPVLTFLLSRTAQK